MSETLLSVEQAAEALGLHPKTVLRYIREGRLPATRLGKAYRIPQSRLDAFAGLASGAATTDDGARVTCVVDIPRVSLDHAERMATLLQSIALTGGADTPPLQVQTAFDPEAKSMKIVVIGAPLDVSRLLEMLQLQLKARR